MRALRLFRSAPALIIGLVAIFMAASPPNASAVTVSYTTTGAFTSSGTATSTAGIVYTPIAAALSIVTPSNSSLGHLSATLIAGSIADSLTITIHQILPGIGIDTVVGTLTGSIALNSSSGQLDFITTEIAVINAAGFIVTYNPQNETFINPISGVPVSIEARIDAASAVPLPASANLGIALFGGLGALGLYRRLKGGQGVFA